MCCCLPLFKLARVARVYIYIYETPAVFFSSLLLLAALLLAEGLWTLARLLVSTFIINDINFSRTFQERLAIVFVLINRMMIVKLCTSLSTLLNAWKEKNSVLQISLRYAVAASCPMMPSEGCIVAVTAPFFYVLCRAAVNDTAFC